MRCIICKSLRKLDKLISQKFSATYMDLHNQWLQTPLFFHCKGFESFGVFPKGNLDK